MSGGENIRRVLADTGIYTLTGDSPIDQEIAAYEAGLGPLEDGMENLEADLFALTATAEGLARWELLCRGRVSGGDLETRRQAAALALSLRGGPITAGQMDGALAMAGIRGSWEEADGKLTIHVEEYAGAAEAEAKRLLARLLPARVHWEITVG